MKSRKGAIISLAEVKSAQLIDSVGINGRRAINMASIREICRALVGRKTPIKPTAATVSEEGKNRTPDFPALQTLHNEYREMLRIWRKAFSDIRNIDSADPISIEVIDKIDVSDMDVGSRFIVDELRRHIKELTKRCNALKIVISEITPLPNHALTEEVTETIRSLDVWLQTIGSGTFTLDRVGLQVSRKSQPGTLIMDAELFKRLQTLVTDYDKSQKNRRNTDG